MKTPEEIKRGLKCCTADVDGIAACGDCPYADRTVGCWVEGDVLERDALDYIRQLEAERDGLLQKLQQPHAYEAQWIGAETPPTRNRDEDGCAIYYLIYDPEDGVDIGNYMPELKTWFCVGKPTRVTHWAAIPEAPREEEHEENG